MHEAPPLSGSSDESVDPGHECLLALEAAFAAMSGVGSPQSNQPELIPAGAPRYPEHEVENFASVLGLNAGCAHLQSADSIGEIALALAACVRRLAVAKAIGVDRLAGQHRLDR